MVNVRLERKYSMLRLLLQYRLNTNIASLVIAEAPFELIPNTSSPVTTSSDIPWHSSRITRRA